MMTVVGCVVALGVAAALTLLSVGGNGVTASSLGPGAREQAGQPKALLKFRQTGRASHYHKSLRGLRTANGERYDPNAMTAAHRRLKLGTYVRVTHLRNKRSIIVRVNDRLPRRGRAIIDLSTMAARKLGMLRTGIAKVRIEALSTAEAEQFSSSH